MQFNTFITSMADLDTCVRAPFLQEVLLESMVFARQGKLSLAQVEALATHAKNKGLRVVLVWDVLAPERVMTQLCESFQNLDLSLFTAIRVCDVGVAFWLKNQFPQLPLQLIVETGNHNLEALQGWCELFGDALERLILSIELPEEKLIEYCRKLPVACEVLGVGQILLFYSPRSLLAVPLTGEVEEDYLETTVAFEEAKDRHFPVIETFHGTLMFLDKDQFILDQLEPLKSANLEMVRLDLRHLADNGNVAVKIDELCQQILENPTDLRLNWPRPTRAPFFKANRTTALFPRMKSKLTHYRGEQCLAEVLAGESGKYVVFACVRPFHISQIDNIIMPTGEAIAIPPNLTFCTFQGEAVVKFEPDQLIITDWIKKAVPGSLLMGNPVQ